MIATPPLQLYHDVKGCEGIKVA